MKQYYQNSADFLYGLSTWILYSLKILNKIVTFNFQWLQLLTYFLSTELRSMINLWNPFETRWIFFQKYTFQIARIFVVTRTVNKTLKIPGGSRDYKGFVTNGGTFLVPANSSELSKYGGLVSANTWLLQIIFTEFIEYKLLVFTENIYKNITPKLLKFFEEDGFFSWISFSNGDIYGAFQ